MPTPLAHTHYEELDLEVGWRLPLTKHIKDSLLGILVLHRRTLRAFEPADHVLHLASSFIALKSSGRLLFGRANQCLYGFQCPVSRKCAGVRYVSDPNQQDNGAPHRGLDFKYHKERHGYYIGN